MITLSIHAFSVETFLAIVRQYCVKYHAKRESLTDRLALLRLPDGSGWRLDFVAFGEPGMQTLADPVLRNLDKPIRKTRRLADLSLAH